MALDCFAQYAGDLFYAVSTHIQRFFFSASEELTVNILSYLLEFLVHSLLWEGEVYSKY